jgi:hypothetical protein
VAQSPPLVVQATSIWKVFWVKFWVYDWPEVHPWAAPLPTCIETVYQSPPSQYGVNAVATFSMHVSDASFPSRVFASLRVSDGLAPTPNGG